MQNQHALLADVAMRLYERWQDEKDYEDFADYIKVMQSRMADGSTITKMTKRPFRVEYITSDGKRRWIAVTSREARWGGYAQN